MSRSGAGKTREAAAAPNQQQQEAAGHTTTASSQPRSQRDTTPLVQPGSLARNSYPTATTQRQNHQQSRVDATPVGDGPDDIHHADSKKFRNAAIILFICILSFVLQTVRINLFICLFAHSVDGSFIFFARMSIQGQQSA